MTQRERAWRDDAQPVGRILVLSRNPIADAVQAIAGIAGRAVHVVAEDDGGPGLDGLDPSAEDAVVLCDHDAPDAPRVLREALASPARYVAMLASRRRAEALLADLADEGVGGLERLHVPAGLDLGGRSPGDIALSVVAEVVADSHGRGGGPMRAG